jgi:hypothetical protein
MSKHTPGPWYLDGEYVNGCGVGDSAGHSIFYACCCGGVSAGVTGSDVDNMKERLANAQLIVAAPEMLEFVRQVANTWLNDCQFIPCDTEAASELSNKLARLAALAAPLLAKIEGGGDAA